MKIKIYSSSSRTNPNPCLGYLIQLGNSATGMLNSLVWIYACIQWTQMMDFICLQWTPIKIQEVKSVQMEQLSVNCLTILITQLVFHAIKWKQPVARIKCITEPKQQRNLKNKLFYCIVKVPKLLPEINHSYACSLVVCSLVPGKKIKV